MKIVTVTMVKNEENIIESFVRHAFQFSDQVIVFNHNSTDGTLTILEALKYEFPDRFILYPDVLNTTMTINQEMFNLMIKYGFEQLGADMVLPLDSDEFPVLLNGGNIRTYLEGLDLNQCYKVHFMPFALAEEWKKDVFVPLLFKRHKKISPDNDFKVFLTRNMYFEYDIEVGLGNHLLWGKKPVPDDLTKDLYPEMVYAHFAFRNKEHLESKLVLRWLSLIMRNDVTEGMAFQYQSGYEKILQGKMLSQEEMDWFCLNNMCAGADNVESVEDIQKLVQETDTRELFENIELKYTHLVQQKNNYVLLMEFVQQVISQYKTEKVQLLENVENLKNQLQFVEQECIQNEHNYLQMKQKYEEASQNLQDIKGSKAWKLIQNYRKIVGKYDPSQD